MGSRQLASEVLVLNQQYKELYNDEDINPDTGLYHPAKYVIGITPWKYDASATPVIDEAGAWTQQHAVSIAYHAIGVVS